MIIFVYNIFKEERRRDEFRCCQKIFPHAFKANDVKALIIGLVVYALIAFVAGLVLGLLGIIPILGFIFRVIGWLVELYCIVGVILSILVFLKIVQ